MTATPPVLTADGVEIVVGMTVWFQDAARITEELVRGPAVLRFLGRGRAGICYSTRRAALQARLAELHAEAARVEAELAKDPG